jgi:hypothetical protein
MGGKSIYEYIHILRNHHIPTFEFPDIAVKIFNYMFRYYYSIKALYETPYPIDTEKFDYINILQMLNKKEKFNQSNSIILTNEESLKLLQYANFNVDSQKQVYTPPSLTQPYSFSHNQPSPSYLTSHQKHVNYTHFKHNLFPHVFKPPTHHMLPKPSLKR